MIPQPKKPSAAIWKISAPDLATLRQVATAQARQHGARGRVILEPGLRVSLLVLGLEPNLNVRLVDGSDDWEDSDLWGHSNLDAFRDGVTLDEDGNAVVDFYLSDPTGLICNVQAWGDASGLVAVTTDGPDGDLTLWRAAEGALKVTQ